MSAAAPEIGGGRAFGPGPRMRLVAAVAAAAFAAVAVVLVLTLGAGGSSRPHSAAGYGHLPAWLPKISNGSPRLEVARAARPVLSEAQGFTVRAVLATGSTDITAVGPAVPGYIPDQVQSGRWTEGRPVPATFVVTLADVSGSVPLSSGAFSILTGTGAILHPKVTVRGGGALPATLGRGQHINLEVRGAVPEGSGSIRWAPLGPRVLVGWIYELELD